MKKRFYFAFFAFSIISVQAIAQSEPFSLTVLNTKPSGTSNDYNLAHPFEILYGRDNYLYITEKVGRVVRVDTGTGLRQVILDIRAQVYLTITYSGGAATSIGQDGMMGMAMHPNFNLGTGQDSVFIAYSYVSGSLRISRFKFNGGGSPSLSGETILIQGIPTSNDHSTGRLIVGADNKLYYACGDKGNNQFGNRCNYILSQDLPSSAEITAANYSKYSGKILRINFDGSIPSDNPLWSSVRSHIYSIGHRNPQGLVWEKNAAYGVGFPVLTTGGKLFSTEHGPRTDDELNIIESGKNYGWPYIAGDSDNVNYQYVIWASSGSCASTSYGENTIPSGATVMQETSAPASVKSNFKKPIFNLYTSCGSNPASVCDAGGTNWLKYPTIAPSSVEYYNLNSGTGIANWYPSLLIPTLRRGVLYRVKLNATKDGVTGDTVPYFRTTNRYRDIAMSPDGLKIYLLTDSIGTTSGPSGSGTSTLSNRGAILEYRYTGATLPLREKDTLLPNLKQYVIDVYPNPTSKYIHVEFEKGLHKPIRYQLFDITGMLTKEGTSAKNKFKIDVANYKPGVYILKLYNGFGVEVKMEKIVIQ